MNSISDLHSSLRVKAKTDMALTEKATWAAETEKEIRDIIHVTTNDLALWSEVSKDDAVPVSLLSEIDARIAGLMKVLEKGRTALASLRFFCHRKPISDAAFYPHDV